MMWTDLGGHEVFESASTIITSPTLSMLDAQLHYNSIEHITQPKTKPSTHTPPHPHARDIARTTLSQSTAYTHPHPPQAPLDHLHSSSHTLHKKPDHNQHTYHG